MYSTTLALAVFTVLGASSAKDDCGAGLVQEMNRYCSRSTGFTVNKELIEEIAQQKVYKSVQSLVMAGEISCYMGMKSGAIPNSAVTASSFWTWAGSSLDVSPHKPFMARLDQKAITSINEACWAPLNDANPWIQVDLGTVQPVAGIITQGRDSPTYIQWMTHFNVAYGNDVNQLMTVQEDGEDKLFVGNVDQYSHVFNWFSSPLMARYIRIYPKNQNRGLCMRFELVGGKCFEY